MKTQLSKPARTKARYTEEYKQEALELSGASESIEVRAIELPRESHARCVTRDYPRRESNSHLRFRKPPFYPLNCGDSSSEDRGQISEIRCQFRIFDTESLRVLATAVGVADFKAKNIRRRLRRKFAIELFVRANP
jgi:hypothetical protein